MQALLTLRERINGLISYAGVAALVDTFNDPLVASEIEDANIAQLQRGERSDGESLPDYSPVSVAVYGRPAGPIKLYDTGDFYRGITLEVDADGFQLIDTDGKTPMLTERYGDEIIGLQEGSLEDLRDSVILPNLQANIAKYLFG